MTEEGLDANMYSMMQTGKSYKRYIKTILGKLYVNVLNPFTDKPDGLIIRGNPQANKEDCIVEVWNDKQDVFFKRMNKRHFEQGFLIEYNPKKEIKKKKSPNQVTDEELIEILNSRFFKFQSEISKFTSPAPLQRLLFLAGEEEKSEKIVKAIEAKIAELQAKEYGLEDTGEEEKEEEDDGLYVY